MAPRDRLVLHIKNNRAGEEVFRVTPGRLGAALAGNPEVATRLTVTLGWDTDHFDELVADAHGLVTWDLPTDDLARRAPALRWIHVIGAGVEHLAPLDWLPDGVQLTNNRGVHAPKAAQYGLMAALLLANDVPALLEAQRAHRWDERFTTTLDGTTVLVIGGGQMGSAVAAALRPHGVRTIGIRRTPRPTDGFDEVHGPERLDELLTAADLVVVTCPLTDETRGLLDARRLGLLPAGAGVVNMGRGAVIDEPALREALVTGHLGGAVLDVFDREPVPADSPLWDTPRLIMTPHVSSDDALHYIPRTLDLVMENAARLLDGADLRNVVDPDLGY